MSLPNNIFTQNQNPTGSLDTRAQSIGQEICTYKTLEYDIGSVF